MTMPKKNWTNAAALLLSLGLLGVTPAALAQPAEKDEKKVEPSDKPAGDKPADKAAEAVGDTPTVYFLPLTGEFGRRISPASLEDALKDARKAQPDYLIVSFDLTWAFGGMSVQSPLQAGQQLMVTWNSGLAAATEMSTLLTDKIRDDKAWTKKPKLIGWIKTAMGPSAILALGFKDLYYTPDARHGGIGYLDFLMRGVDETVRQKQISLREGAVRGLGNKGGYNEMIIQAMTKTNYVLSVTYEGGEPKLFPDATGEELLTDDGVEGNRDTLEELARGRGNDTLTLTADTAMKLKVSKGTAATQDELLEQLGIVRNYKKLDSTADSKFRNWENRVQRAEQDMEEFMRQLQGVRAENDTPDARVAARGRQIGLMERCRRLIEQYNKSLSPEVLGDLFGAGDPEQALTQLGVQIERLKQQNMYDRR
jgi:hypothetical protein